MEGKPSRGKMIAHFLYGYKRYFLIALSASILSTIFNFLMPQVLRITVDSVIGDKPFNIPAFITQFLDMTQMREFLRSNLLICAGAVLLFALFSGVFTYANRVNTYLGAEGFVKKIRDTLFTHIQRLPFSWHVKHPTGDIIQRCTSDVLTIQLFVATQMMELIRTAFLISFAMFFMFSMSVKMSLAVLCFIPAIVAYSGIFYTRMGKSFRKADEAEGALSALIQENLTGVRVVRAFGREKYEMDRFDQKANMFVRLWLKFGNQQSWYWGLGDLITGFQIMTVITLGTIETVQGNITLGEFLVYISYNATLVWPIRGLGRILANMSKARVSIDRVNEILTVPAEQDRPNAVTPSMKGDIEFKNVTFYHDGQKPVLKNINLTIKQGTTFGILGGTGSGKTTLTHLLDRLYELPRENGQILINGVDINDIQLDYLRKNIGMVLQEPFLFSRTIHENIAATEPHASREEIRECARIACVDDNIMEFTDDYDTIVGERGVTLSGGQKQRVAIARMLMQRAPIMIFDDSLSAVDSDTDHKIRMALKNNLGDSTVIIISHRITTLMLSDNIMVLENGEITALGTHEELIQKEGLYKSIYEIQMNPEEGGDENA